MERYWRMTAGEVESSLGTSAIGLSSKEARARLLKYGPNEIEKTDRKTPIRIFITQFQNPLVYILIGATAIAALLGDAMEALIILAILVVNALLGFIQEYRSERALEELRKYVSMTARVMRDGQIVEHKVQELVPGDVILLAIGDIVPADARIIETHGLETNESVLTGESNPVEKDAKALTIDEPAPHELSNTLFMGSVVTAGAGKAIVIGTAKNTYLGKSAKAIGEAGGITDFEKSIRSFGSMLVRVVLIMTVFVFIVNGMLGHGLLESLLFALAIAVGITPELLPVIITIGLSHGAMMLVQKHVVVKRLEAIEDLGNIDILCADKTGTLTENAVSLIRYVNADGEDDERILVYSLLCNSAVVQHGRVRGGTIDSAIWTYALSRFDMGKTKGYAKVDEVPFDYSRKRMSVIVEHRDERVLITKGAPETIFPSCSKVREAGKEKPISKSLKRLIKTAEGFGSEGYRVIAVAARRVKEQKEYSAKDELGLVFMGFLILMDPPKKDAMPALERFRKLGVEVYVLTGDGPLVTENVCAQVGVHNKAGTVLQGFDIARMGEAELRSTVEKHNIYARLAPNDKLAIVNALRANGHIVGFIGDGVNDASSLKAADVGISVNNGTDIAKEAADVVLMRKSLNAVANGISEGRRTFANIIKYIDSTISANFGNMFTLTIASLFLPFIPLLPSQILFNNFLSDVPMLAVSTDSVDKDELKKPKRWDIGRISRFMVFFGLISSVFDLITMAFVFFIFGANAPLFRTVWFLESVLSEIFVVFAVRTAKPLYKSVPSLLLVNASIFATLAAIGVLYSPLAPYFEFAPLSIETVGIVLMIVAAYVGVVELAKGIFLWSEAKRKTAASSAAKA
ncbi:MAG: magnesium-translocating P-type ATPase [Candidatus Micrarchaeota archaeon]